MYATGGSAGAAPGTEVPIGRLGNGLKVVQAVFFSSIAKTDWETGRFVQRFPGGGESCPCEPVFVGRPAAKGGKEELCLTCDRANGDHSHEGVRVNGYGVGENGYAGREEEVEEDDGVVLTIVIDKKGEKSILVALDGKTLKEVARAVMPQVYAMGPHGSFIEKKGMY